MRPIALFLIVLATAGSALAVPPTAPSNLVATAPDASYIQLTWQDNSDSENGFQVFYRVGTSGDFTVLGTTSPNRTSVLLDGVLAQTTYQYVVRAFIFSGPEFSDIAGPATTTTPAYPPVTWQNPPALLAPTSGPALSNRTLTIGTTPTVVPLAGLFTDPDVTSAARLTTDLGPIDFVFFPGTAPLTVANFLGYLQRGDFQNTIFHRSVPGFVVQGGGFRADATASAVTTQPPVTNEPAIHNVRGTVAMARSIGINSATNQFFINIGNNSITGLNNLDTGTSSKGGFTVFARVAGNGMAVADAIAALPVRSYTTINGALTDTPVRGTPPASYNPAALVRINAATVVSPLALSASVSPAGIVSPSITGTDLTLTALLPGTATITLTATDLDLQTATSAFAVTVLDSYPGWAARQTFGLPADALASADPDHDGRINLVEFALASAPLAASASDLVPSVVEGNLTYTFPVRRYLGVTTVALQSAEEVTGPWTTRWTNQDGLTHAWIATHQPSGEADLITARDPAPAPSPRRFLRLLISQP